LRLTEPQGRETVRSEPELARSDRPGRHRGHSRSQGDDRYGETRAKDSEISATSGSGVQTRPWGTS
jgi:hypothetical protein